MGRAATVIDVEADGDIRCDEGGDDPLTADGYQPAGDDSPPRAGDEVGLADGVETGGAQVIGYNDDTTKKAAKGEKRIYSRTLADGTVVAEVYLKGDGTIVLESLIPGGAKISLLPGGDVLLGGSATELVALASKVEKAISAALSVGALHTPAAAPGPATFLAVKTAWDTAMSVTEVAPPLPVGAAKTKAQ